LAPLSDPRSGHATLASRQPGRVFTSGAIPNNSALRFQKGEDRVSEWFASVEAAPAGPWPKKPAICSAHAGAGQIFLDEWLG
jgi:hypothetical protein